MSRQFATMINAGLSLLRALTILAEQTENKALAGVLARGPQRRRDRHRALRRAGQAPRRLPAADGQHGPGRRGRRLPRPGAAADRRELRGRGQAARQDQVRDDLPGRRVRHRDPGGRSACCCSSSRSSRRCSTTSAASCRRPTQILVCHVARAEDLVSRDRGRGSSCSRSSGRKVKHNRAVPQRRRPAEAQGARSSARCSRRSPWPVHPQLRHDDPLRRPDPAGLDIVGDTTGNIVLERAVKDVQESVRQRRVAGRRRWRNHPVFPPMVVQMMAVGEDTGALDTMLHKIAEFYDQEVEATTEALTALIEPLMIAVPRRHRRVDDHRPLHADLQDLRPDQVARCLGRLTAFRAGPASCCGPGRSAMSRAIGPIGWSSRTASPVNRSSPAPAAAPNLVLSSSAPARNGTPAARRGRKAREPRDRDRGQPSCLGRHPRGVPRGTGGAAHGSVLKGRSITCSLASARRWTRTSRASP